MLGSVLSVLELQLNYNKQLHQMPLQTGSSFQFQSTNISKSKQKSLKYLVLGEPSADSSGLLGTQIKRQELLVLVHFSQGRLLLL